uniref:ATP synthase subunit a n=1 Tax=Ammophila sabulosa TaxID=1088610 RepID=A0A7L7S019_9HYME|nr:ATP synthase F0 subunit 6 [Ammophila sabulosa]
MLLSLFSSFDPTSYFNMKLNWLSTFIMFIIMPQMLWLSNSKLSYMYYNSMFLLYKEMNIIMKNKNNMIIFMCLFMTISMNNLMGLIPYIFTSSSHLMFSMTFSMTLWISFMLYGWTNKTNHMFTHLVPKSTPSLLMPFMVLIESISNIIRPYTLSIRLSANMIAGHILLTLIGNTEKNSSYVIMLILIQNLLMILELSVTFIQAYVFSILSILYASE